MLPDLLSSSNTYNKDLSHLATGQDPHTIFIGCIDSRVIPHNLLGTEEGEMLVVRNIANQLDLPAIQFAMKKSCTTIVVCGHSGCGGIQAAIGEDGLTEIDDHVRPIRRLQKQYKKLVQNQSMLLEWLNVLSSVKEVSRIPCVRKKLEHRKLHVYGMYFDIGESRILPLAVISSWDQAKSFCVEHEIRMLLDNLGDY
eukprot:NODE_979_length_2802_cov_0.471698.p2 type:complete len:197 gc:universal NODE_979_length_2802_cov_0.471698:1746-2336(+)